MTEIQRPDADKTVDAKGLECPMPILQSKMAIAGMQHGQILEVHTTDPHASIDFHSFCARAGHTLLAELAQEGVLSFYLQINRVD